jgi:hypothetical protein
MTIRGTVVLSGVVFALGCDSGYGSAPLPTPTYAGQGDNGHAGEEPPMKLVLEPVDDAPESPVVTLRAHVDARGAFSVPVTLSIELPPGQRHALLSPAESHRIDVTAAGRTTREFQVVRTAVQAPVKVIMDARDPNGAYGVHAEAWHPSALAPAQDFVVPVRPPSVRPPGPARLTLPSTVVAGAAKEVAR